jgi:hypothetical protein
MMMGMRYARFLAFFWLGLYAHAENQPSCASIAGTSRLWARPGVRFVIIGEMHGTAEMPALFRDLVCSVFKAKRRLLVGVELSDQHQIDLFTGSTDDEAAVRQLTSGKEFGQQDGRGSNAMLALLQALREFKRKGLISNIVAFADSSPQHSPAQGEKRMAEALATASIPNALTIVLTGNVHACKGALPDMPSYPFMASFLPPAETMSLFVIDRGGEAWNCQDGTCGPHRLPPGKGTERGITLSPAASPFPGYDGVLSTGIKSTASPPATAKK